MRRLILALAVGLALPGCTAQWADQCQSLGLQRGSGDFAQCVLAKEAMFTASMNSLAANLNALAIANTPQRIYVQRGW
jgi:hypothetical protein